MSDTILASGADNHWQGWEGPLAAVAFDAAGIQSCLLTLNAPCYVVEIDGRIGLTNRGNPVPGRGSAALIALAPAVPPEQLGHPGFRSAYGVRYAYAAGAMANGIASVDLVVAMGKEGLMSTFGAAGLVPSRIREAIHAIRAVLPHGPYAMNLIHSPSEESIERGAVELFLEEGIRTVEASAFLELTPTIVWYRAAGLRRGAQGEVVIGNRVIAKVSRREVASQFMQPAPERILSGLVASGHITSDQAAMAALVPVADDITAEADSGGHTDNRPLVALLPSMIALRDELQARFGFAIPIRVGAAGGIGTPAAALAAFIMGAAYVVTGSINQACVEAGASLHTKQLLAQADMADVMMAPAADMFEAGVKLQVLKRGTFFPMRAQKLYELYKNYESIEDIPADERARVEKQTFRRPLQTIWEDTVQYFQARDPRQIERAQRDPKAKMALIFRWYLGLSSRWSNSGETGREMDYQIWCGPAMGAFNSWVRGSALELPENRRVADVAARLMAGAAFLYRVQALETQGIQLPAALARYPLPAARPEAVASA